MKRVGALLMAGSLLVFTAGCRRTSNTNSAAAYGSSVSDNPVGPVPGGVSNANYPTNPYASDPVAMQDGRRLFNWYNCSGCHGGHAGGGMGPSLRDPAWLYGNRPDQIFDSIAHGRSKGMPAWGSKIPENQIWELVAYIKSMGTSAEPEPPREPADEQVPNPQQEEKPNVGTQTTSAEKHP